MSYTDVFGSDTIPVADPAYSALTLSANTTFVWPYNASDTDTAIAKILDITCSAGVAMTLPPANDTSVGDDFLLRNVGAETLTIKDSSGATIDTITAGTAKYYFITDNSTAAGVWGKVTFGAGSSSATAGDLIGYGIKAASNTLNQAHPVTTDADNVSIDATFRAKLVVSTGGACTVSLAAVATLGDDFFFLYNNAGTGTATINPDGAETFDGAATFMVQPGESLIAVCSGTAWYSVGYGRSTLYQFTQLVKDVSAAGSFTLSASEASNKLLSFTGNPAGAVTIVVPNTVAIYYCQSAISTAQTITVKTAAGTGSAITQSQRQILICDGTNVTSAQSAVASGSISFDAGSAASPSINFAAATNTGVFLKGANGVGLSANGVEIGSFEPTGLELVNPLAVTEGGTGVTTSTGTGAVVRATSPALVTPDLGTPTALVLTNATGLPTTGLANDAVTYAKMQNVSATDKVLGRSTAGAGDVEEISCTAFARSILDDPDEATFKATVNLEIGVDVQAFDADTAKTDATQTFTVPQRGTITTDNDGSFDLNATNNFKCTPTGAVALTFTNIASAGGQSGNILLINGSNYAITAHANTKVSGSTLATLSLTGTYLLGYFCDGTDVYVAATGAMA